MRLVHITPHLGGGVGKAVATLIRQAAVSRSDVRHSVLCLEQPEKRHAVDALCAVGCPVTIAPSLEEARRAIAEADMVQLEFWNHPEIPRLLCALGPVSLRLLAWCHVSGLHAPAIPAGLLESDALVVFTSPCSLANPRVRRQGRDHPVVSSGCVDELPAWNGPNPPRIGYAGTLNFAKLHPDFVGYLAELPADATPVHLYGDAVNRDHLEAQCAAAGRPSLLRFHGYADDMPAALQQLGILCYLLHPQHYGTAENALIEAMAMGVVPVVLDNPAERAIVMDGDTGFVVADKAGFRAAMLKLLGDPALRGRMARRGAASVRSRFTAARMESGLAAQYKHLIKQDKKEFRFERVFGATPGEWFASFQPAGPVATALDAPSERRKGSLHHFLEKFPDDPTLRRWADDPHGALL
ncbi:glycosyltransferase family 4 protein [Oceanibaculum pacificum]|uniref:Glycosyl transferase family 1 domain-containing protein n=1 Tax=Oceanibaculum pacificum TaxID=580166 RepID=A0A154WFA8_9PROT|nr:glycosyltransferase family 4 protein [Oceanibaculum pacificum]KZD12200.1 hypothetical protein AUP43_05185 [Oceanibaculum pacificum]